MEEKLKLSEKKIICTKCKNINHNPKYEFCSYCGKSFHDDSNILNNSFIEQKKNFKENSNETIRKDLLKTIIISICIYIVLFFMFNLIASYHYKNDGEITFFLAIIIMILVLILGRNIYGHFRKKKSQRLWSGM